ncbi:MAG: polysaccharide biosynthesis protein [Clostridiales bacterium]|nr:polysaccharide biosynthesis protein [Clostridiales bacterium]
MSNTHVEKREKSSHSKLLRGATILAAAGIVCKALGAVFRVPLTNLIGAEGMSYYGAVYPIYSLFLVLATAGLPVAISRMVSARTALGDHKNAFRVYKISFVLMLSIGFVSFAICFFGAGFISEKMGNPGAKASLMAIAPALLFAPIASSFRGYYQGRQNMIPTATSEIAEQLFRVIVGLSLSFFLVSKSVELASAGATFGATAGLIAAIVILSIIFVLDRKKRETLIGRSHTDDESRKSILKELLVVSIPITIGSTIMPIMMSIDAVVIMNRLQATGWSYTESKTLYGLISGYTDPLIGFPGVFIDAVSMSLLPAVTAAFTLRNKKELDKNIQAGIKTMMVVAIPCAIGLMVMASPILHLLYPSRPEEADMATLNLQILALSVITLSAMRTFSTSLQAIGKMMLPVYNLLIGAVVKFVITYVLVGIPSLNINGAAIGSVTAYLVAGILNYYALKRHANVSIHLTTTFIKPLFSAGVMGVATFLTYKGVMLLIDKNSVATLFAIIIAVVVYAAMILATKTLNHDELLMLPAGKKIVRLTDKIERIFGRKNK